MKKTLIALLAAATCAMGSELTFDTVPSYGGTQGGSYCGVVFTLASADTQRFDVLGGELTPQVTLGSISLLERGGNYNLADDRVLYITDDTNTYLGSSDVFTKADGSDLAVFDFGNSITLDTTKTYYAYMTTSASDDAWVAGETVVPAGQYYSGHLAACGGSLTSGNSANWGFLGGQKSLASTTYAPDMSITVSTVAPAVPEPATATLSLLALAGLAARRRR
ncbi:MAG: PEP-CTERM sorting domain-containing protein [Akkermansia sp.]|nr:PEP-CTERM sorting domain-containing protein [Akkermansia sp.]